MIENRCFVTCALLAAALLLMSGLCRASKPSGAEQLSDAEWSSVHAQIVAYRYRAEGDAADGYRARNTSLGLTQRYHPDGRTEVDGLRLGVSLQLEGYGYGELIKPGRPVLRAEEDGQGSVVHYQWDENLREWWQNRPGILEQWFELQQRPAGADGGALRLQMALQVPDETPVELDPMGQELRIGEGEGALRYAGLKVWDADGQILSARMHLNPAGDLLLSIDDATARYPVTIDPAMSQEVFFKLPFSASDANDRFGFSVAMTGGRTAGSLETLVIGAPFEDGSGINGDPTNNLKQNSGAAYVFVRNGGTQWTMQAYLKARNAGESDLFGYSVAVSGETIVVGAPHERSEATGINGNDLDDSMINSGAAYVFVRTGGSTGFWSQQLYLKASNTDRFDEFGHAVAVSGDLVVVGAPGESSSATGINGNQANNSAEDSGAVYVFGRASNGQWFQLDYAKASNTGAGDRFGQSVAIDGNTIVVGAHLEDSNATGIHGDQSNNGATDSGAAYVFVRTFGVLFDMRQQAYLKASNTGAGDLFGYSLAISGDTVVVGAYAEDSNATGVNGDQSNNSGQNSGAAYVFVRSGENWSQQAYLKASNTGALDQFGISVGISGNLLAVGANLEDSNARGIDGDQANNSVTNSGAVYAFVRSGSDWVQESYIKASDAADSDQFGSAVAVSGKRLVVGAPRHGTGDRSASGAAYGFHLEPSVGGSVAGLAAGRSLTLQYDNSTILVNPRAIVVNTNGAFNFGTVPFDSSYLVTVASQPAGQICTVANGSGIALTEITNIAVNCASPTFTIGGSLSGLGASRIVTLENADTGESLTLTSNGAFSFLGRLGTGNTYNIVVAGQPNGQTCTVANGSGTVTGNVSNIEVSCTVNTYSISVTLTGLDAGLSVTLQSGADSLTRTTNGLFVFPTRVTHGDSYAVIVTSQPVGKTCRVVVGNESGNAFGDISLQVSCARNVYTIGGTVSGLAPGRSLTLRQVTRGNNLVVSANGSFAFGGTLTHDAAYEVIVFTQPTGQTCTVSNGAGVVTADVTDIEVSCVTNSHSIGGTVFGLSAGGSLTLQNNGGDDLTLSANGAFVFPTQVLFGDPYEVTVSSAPPGQTCFVYNGSGTVPGTVSNIQIDCVTGNPTTIGGTVSGLGSGLTITVQNNGRDDLTLSSNGAFVFSSPISEGATYLVTVRTGPAVQTCTVSNGSGVATANVTDVVVTCTDNSFSIFGSLGGDGLFPNRSITLQNNGGDDLVLGVGGTPLGIGGTFEFPTQLPLGAPYNVTVSSQPLGQSCTVFDGTGTIVGDVDFLFVECFVTHWMIRGTVSGLAPGASLTLQNNGGADLTLDADGSFVFLVPRILGGRPYLVSVSAQPVGQTCTVSNGAGNATSDVNNVAVNCVSFAYTVGGSVSGLLGSGLVLRINDGDDLTVSSDGTFTFATLLSDLADYEVAVFSQPDAPSQTCSVLNGSGTIGGANVTTVQVNCATNVYSVTATALGGGTITPQMQQVEQGAAATFTISADAGWVLDSVTGNTCTPEAQGGGNWSAPQITQDCGVLASFSAVAADLQVAKDAGVDTALDGQVLVYAITVANAGPLAVHGAQLADTLPVNLVDAEWACLPAASNTPCPAAPFNAGSGNLYAEIDLPVDGFLRYDLSARVQGTGGTQVSNTATITPPAGVDDLDTSNNSATDTVLIVPEGVFSNGFEAPPGALTVPAAASAQREATGR